MPVRSSRRLYKIEEITVLRPGGGTPVEEPIVVKMKQSHADLLGLEPIPSDDPIWIGTFGGSGSNAGKKYHRNLGGFRERAYTLIAQTEFTVNERDSAGTGTVASEFKTLTIGFPRGASVNEVFLWLKDLPVAAQTAAIISPAGRRIPLDETASVS